MDGSLFRLLLRCSMLPALNVVLTIRLLLSCRCMKKMPTSRLGEEAGTHRVDGGVRSAVASRLTTLPIDGIIVAQGWFLVYRASVCVVPLRVLAVCYTLALLSGPDGRAMYCLQCA